MVDRSESHDDLVAVLTAEHRHIDGLFGRYQALADAEPSQRRVAAYTVAEQLRQHLKTEHRYLHTAIRDRLPGGPDFVGHLEREQDELEHVLHNLEQPEVEEADFNALFSECAEWFRRHVSEVESSVFPRLYRLVDPEWLHAAGARILAESL